MSVWIAAIGVFVLIAADYFSLDGYGRHQYAAGQASPWFSRMYSASNYELITGEPTYFRIHKFPTAFNLKVPISFDDARIKIFFKADDLESFQFGVIENQGKSDFRLREILIDSPGQWHEQTVEIDLTDAYRDPKEGYGFVFLAGGGDLNVARLEIELVRDNLWKTLKNKLKTAPN